MKDLILPKILTNFPYEADNLLTFRREFCKPFGLDADCKLPLLSQFKEYLEESDEVLEQQSQAVINWLSLYSNYECSLRIPKVKRAVGSDNKYEYFIWDTIKYPSYDEAIHSVNDEDIVTTYLPLHMLGQIKNVVSLIPGAKLMVKSAYQYWLDSDVILSMEFGDFKQPKTQVSIDVSVIDSAAFAAGAILSFHDIKFPGDQLSEYIHEFLNERTDAVITN